METEPQGLNENPKPQKVKKSLSVVNRMIGLAFLCAVGALLLLLLIPGKNAPEEEQHINLNEISFKIKSSEASNYVPMGINHLLWLDGSGIAVLNVAGAEVQRIDTVMNAPIVARNGQYTLVAEFDAYKYVVLTASGLVYQGKTEEPIKAAAVGPRGHAALVLDKADTKGILRVFDGSGKRLFDWISLDRMESGAILGAQFSSDNSRLMVSLLNTDSAASFPIVNVFSLFQENLGSKLLTLTPANFGPVTYMQALGPQRMVFASPTSIGYVDGEQLAGRLQFARVKSVLAVNERIFALAAEKENEPLKLYYWDGKSEKASLVSEESFSEAALHLSANKAYFAVADNKKILIYDASGPRLLRTVEANENVLGGSTDEDGSILFITRDEIKRLRY